MSYNIAGNIRNLRSSTILYCKISQFPALEGYDLCSHRGSYCHICFDSDINIQRNVCEEL